MRLTNVCRAFMQEGNDRRVWTGILHLSAPDRTSDDKRPYASAALLRQTLQTGEGRAACRPKPPGYRRGMHAALIYGMPVTNDPAS